MRYYVHMWILYALLSALFAGMVAVFGKMGIKNVDSTLATMIRGAIMFFFLFVAATALGKLPLLTQLNKSTLGWIALSGLAGALSWFFYFLALKTGTAVGVAALDRLSVIFALVGAALLLGEKITLLHGLGALLVAGGAFLLIQ